MRNTKKFFKTYGFKFVKIILSMCLIIAALRIILGGEDKVNKEKKKENFLYFTAATDERDSFKRFMRSAATYSLHPKVLGLGFNWIGKKKAGLKGRGFKVNFLREELKKYKNDKDLIVLFTDSYDIILTGGVEEILKKFRSFNAGIVFAAESNCWPDKNKEKYYPKVSEGYRFLNSGGYIGYAPFVYDILSTAVIDDFESDQLYFTKIYTNSHLRRKLNIKLDSKAEIFQCIGRQSDIITLDFQEDDTRLFNKRFNTTPVIIHGNGIATKANLTTLGNYLAKTWVKKKGCLYEKEIQLNVRRERESVDYPKVLIAIFISTPTPFLEEFLDKIAKLNYPKNKIFLFGFNKVRSHEELVKTFFRAREKENYVGFHFIGSSDVVEEFSAKKLSLKRCYEISCDAYFNVDSNVHLDNPETLKLLTFYNRSAIAPIITDVDKKTSTFLGARTREWRYVHSFDYMDIINGTRRCIWNVPFISFVYLIRKDLFIKPNGNFENLYEENNSIDQALTTKDVFMYAVNLDSPYGHLVKTEEVSTKHLHNDLWQVSSNELDWEARYLHPQYYNNLNLSFVNEEPYKDKNFFPLFSSQFCKEFIETAENYGKRSRRTEIEPNEPEGYKNAHTERIHLSQIGFEEEWNHIFRKHIAPRIQRSNYRREIDTKTIISSFVIRFTPGLQSSVASDIASSSYVVTIALNSLGLQEEKIEKCFAFSSKQGWASILLTNQTIFNNCEGLSGAEEKLYLLVSFLE